MRWLYRGIALLLIVASSKAEQIPDSSSDEEDSNSTQNKGKGEPKKVISLSESLGISRRNFQDPEAEEVRKQYWKRTFSEIRNMATTGFPKSSQPKASGGGKFLSQWKLLLDDPLSQIVAQSADDDTEDASLNITSPAAMRRFEGFVSWERLLQDWSDDVQEYLEKAKEENEGEYSMSNFGRSVSPDDETKARPSEPLEELQKLEEVNGATQDPPGKATSVKQNTGLPIPAPAKPGEAVLPHTDISDKSKRILIVTTAAMPWRTGTAVNPLLRAAYLTKGRKSKGGSVTLMLPWLERKSDQETVYGADNTFETEQDQEDYIRTWLRDDAGFVEASKELKIQWYTGWQNKIQNSIYSMGDITALVSADDVDICILEEPEHLNW